MLSVERPVSRERMDIGSEVLMKQTDRVMRKFVSYYLSLDGLDHHHFL